MAHSSVKIARAREAQHRRERHRQALEAGQARILTPEEVRAYAEERGLAVAEEKVLRRVYKAAVG